MGKPKIRFKGYTTDWEQRKLEDFGKATGGTSIESEFSEDGIYKVVSIGSYSENSVYNDQGIRAIKSDKTCNRVLNRNDLTMILNDKTTSGNIIGRVLLIEESGIYVYNQRTERIEINLDEYDPVFLYEMLNAPNIREKIIKQAQGNTQIYVNWTAISLLEYMIPSKEEQVKIGEYLHNISNLITLHQRKYEEMKTLKRYMLQKMFPQSEQKVPEIRFAGFTEAWEQRKLGDEATEMLAGGDIDKSRVVENGQYPIYANALTNDGIVGYYDDYYRVKAPAVTVTGRGDVGHAQARTVDFTPVVRLLAIRSEHDVHFLENAINKHGVIVESTGVPQLTVPQLGNYIISFPTTIEEEIKIGNYFHNLDHLITLHQQKCEELKNIKKFMLQNMFV